MPNQCCNSSSLRADKGQQAARVASHSRAFAVGEKWNLLATREIGELDRLAVLQIHAGDGDGADLIFNFNSQRIAVSIFPSSSNHDRNRRSIQDHLIDVLGRAASDDMGDFEYEELKDEILGVILDAGRTIFKAQATLQIKLNPPRDLHSAIYPPTLHFQLLDTDGKPVIIPIEPSDTYTLSAEDELDINNTLPYYTTKAILIREIRVLVNGKEIGLIGTSELDATIHTPHEDMGRIVGFLRQWIPGRRLRDIDVPATPVQRRQKWIRQIREVVHTLHAKEIIWGDGKASNVIIDEQDDVWLIDFGGGWTYSWVDEELVNTIEGDALAISKLSEFLVIN
ncbi:uncharacterized protein F5Z01DRAFT_689593 [Emericellopsis atlantica]|uniref:Protein kinase domain-containing protein n=1 Tax=Emericellopsis atlantica TaxID=2614577 RepID=A0A9P7ZJJ4_9HYPO|nr:uncharacterized protein F5Z01DRAFT_689593 [Emericellopsis atlantica]KAG9252907.1 hypothetical protein F5Z01DRAFT_689593 [Emericellopsis atlantica]